MAEYLKSMLSNRRAIVAGTIETLDLPVNPISHIDIDVDMILNAAWTPATWVNLGAIFDRVDVMYKGTSIISLNGADLLAYCAALQGKTSPIINRDIRVASLQTVRFRLPFGRYPYGGVECFPAVRRGELQLRMDYAAAFTNIVTLAHTITTTELMGATPKQFLKATTISLTPVVGDNDLDLPLGNKIAGLLMFSTTVPGGTANVTSIDLVKLLRDNVEHYLHQVRWPVLVQELYNILGWNSSEVDHQHRENLGSAWIQNAQTSNMKALEEFLVRYGFIDFDPLKNDTYFLDTAGAGRIWLRITAGDTNAIRVIPIEVIEVPAA